MVRRIGLLVIGSVVLGMPSAHAAVITVTTTADGVPGSLRAAFGTANANGEDDEIVLQAGAEYQLTLCGGVGEEDANADGDLDHTAAQALTITGNGATIRNTCPDERVIEQLGTGPFAAENVTITGGDGLDFGGGISTSGADITITNSTFAGNTAADDGGGIYTSGGDVTIVSSTFSTNTAGTGNGGGVRTSSGTITVINSTFTGNTAAQDGGGIRTSSSAVTITGSTFAGNTATFEDGGVLRTSSGDVTATNSTFSGNTAGTYGGGIFSDASGSITLNNATLIGNDATTGDALGVFSTGTAQFANTILSAPGDDCGGGGTFTSNGHNIGSDTSCNLTGIGDKPNTDPKLGALADNGGPTQTHALLPGSPAIDAGNPAAPGSGGNACEATDQRGLPRTSCDIGAYELVLCAKVPVNRIGTPGKDTLTGTPGPDGLLGLQGNDRLAGKAGKDGLCGGPGKDTLKGGGGKDRLDGGPGKDLCVGQAGRDKAKGCERKKRIP